jgi:hypothetical protein
VSVNVNVLFANVPDTTPAPENVPLPKPAAPDENEEIPVTLVPLCTRSHCQLLDRDAHVPVKSVSVTAVVGVLGDEGTEDVVDPHAAATSIGRTINPEAFRRRVRTRIRYDPSVLRRRSFCGSKGSEKRSMLIEFVNHASLLVTAGGVRLMSDPWLEGRVFHEGGALTSNTSSSGRFPGAARATIHSGGSSRPRPTTSMEIARARAENVEVEWHPAIRQHPTTLRMLSYFNHANMGDYRAAVERFQTGTRSGPDD